MEIDEYRHLVSQYWTFVVGVGAAADFVVIQRKTVVQNKIIKIPRHNNHRTRTLRVLNV